jgi:DNA-binding beta-propeller fold protein YncE
LTHALRPIVALAILAAALAWPIAHAGAGGVDGPTALAGSADSVWVADTSGDVRLLDAGNRVVRATVHVGGYPDALAVDRRSVWVSTLEPNALVRISRATNRRVGAPISLGNGQPLHIADGGGTLWVVDQGDDRVWRFDARNGHAQGSTVVSPEPWLGAVVAADASGAWVASYPSTAASTLVRLDPRGRVVARRRVPRIEIVALAIAGDTLLAVGGSDGKLLRLDARTGAPTSPALAVGRGPIALAVGAGTVWISSLGEHRAIREIGLRSSRTLVGPVRAPGRAARADDLAVAGGYLWATNAYGILSRLDARTGSLRGPPIRVP